MYGPTRLRKCGERLAWHCSQKSYTVCGVITVATLVMFRQLPIKLKGTLCQSAPGETLLLCALFYLKLSRFSLLLTGSLLPYHMRFAYLVRRSCMFCLICSSFCAVTAFFILCWPILVFTCGGLNRMWFLSLYGYTY